MWPYGVAEAWAAMYGVDLDEYKPKVHSDEDYAETFTIRWCECGCSQKSVQAEPCWNCGSVEPRLKKPAWWPPGGASMTVERGDQWSPGEEDDVLHSEGDMQDLRTGHQVPVD